MLDTYRVCDLAQLRLLADPLKLRIIQALAERPRTTREVAALMGENLTRLYRHIDALLDAGLIEITHEEQKRGAIERTFEAVARRFEVDHDLLAADDGNDAIRKLLRAGEAEILEALAQCGGVPEPLLMRLRLKGSAEQLRRLRALLDDWLESAQELDGADVDADAEEYGALIAYYAIRPRGRE